MLTVFCLRLACGLIGALALFPPRLVNPRFYRVQFLTALGLAAVAAVAGRGALAAGAWGSLLAAMALAFLGSLVWSLDGAPGGKTLIALTFLALAAALGLGGLDSPIPGVNPWLRLAGELTSAALLGMATTAMLMGHSYLIAPAMSLTPLRNLLGGLAAALLLRMAVAAAGLWSWTAGHSLVNLEDETVLWLPLRWGLGFVGPLVLGWMAWQAARIRSTQSATGILYVVVICCFLGELTGQLLVATTGCVL
jgi:hypothetical protein